MSSFVFPVPSKPGRNMAPKGGGREYLDGLQSFHSFRRYFQYPSD